jgi:predicted acetyltransferase
LDNNGEFVSKAFNQVLKDHGIEKQMFIPYTPQQNGMAERVNCTIVEMAKNMFRVQKLNKSVWTKAVVNKVIYKSVMQQEH